MIFNIKIDPIKINAYTLTGRRGLYGLFPTQFNHPTLNIPENSQVKIKILRTQIFTTNRYTNIRVIFSLKHNIFRSWKVLKRDLAMWASPVKGRIFWPETSHYELRKTLSRLLFLAKIPVTNK